MMTTDTTSAAPVTCGNGCACATQCGDTYEANGLPRPPLQRPTLAIVRMATSAQQAVDCTLHEAEARHLVGYIQEIEGREREASARARAGTAGLRPQVLAFAWLMEHKLRKHDGPRGVHGWKGAQPEALRERVDVEAGELNRALGEWYKPQGDHLQAAAHAVGSEAADVANFCMMTADACGALEGVGPGPVVKLRKSLRQIHRLHSHIARLIDRRLADEEPYAPKILALQADEKALAWVLHALDPNGVHAPAQRDPEPPTPAADRGPSLASILTQPLDAGESIAM